MAPPMTITSFAFRNVSGSSEAARARLVSGPSATMLIVSGGDSRRMSKMAWWEGRRLGVKSLNGVALDAFSRKESGEDWKASFQVSAGLRCGCFCS
jgi:hypothetical protein